MMLLIGEAMAVVCLSAYWNQSISSHWADWTTSKAPGMDNW